MPGVVELRTLLDAGRYVEALPRVTRDRPGIAEGKNRACATQEGDKKQASPMKDAFDP